MNGATAPSLTYVHILLAAFPERAQGGGAPADPQPTPLHPSSFIPHPSVELLSARELDVLRLIAAGRSNREIAAALDISVRTVNRHITNLYTKVGARGKADATAYALRHRLA